MVSELSPMVSYKQFNNKCSDRCMEVKPPALLGIIDRQTNRPTDGRTDGLIGKCHFQYYALHDIIILHHLTFIHLGAIELSLNGLCTEFALLWGGWENNGSGIISRNQIGRSDASRISVFPFCLLVSKCIKQFIHMILIFFINCFRDTGNSYTSTDNDANYALFGFRYRCKMLESLWPHSLYISLIN